MTSDQQWYTLHEFQDYYGSDRAARLWEEARREEAKVDVAKDPPPQPQVSHASAAQPASIPPPQPQQAWREEAKVDVAKHPPPQPQVSNASPAQPARPPPPQPQPCPTD